VPALQYIETAARCWLGKTRTAPYLELEEMNKLKSSFLSLVNSYVHIFGFTDVPSCSSQLMLLTEI